MKKEIKNKVLNRKSPKDEQQQRENQNDNKKKKHRKHNYKRVMYAKRTFKHSIWQFVKYINGVCVAVR